MRQKYITILYDKYMRLINNGSTDNNIDGDGNTPMKTNADVREQSDHNSGDLEEFKGHIHRENSKDTGLAKDLVKFEAEPSSNSSGSSEPSGVMVKFKGQNTKVKPPPAPPGVKFGRIKKKRPTNKQTNKTKWLTFK
jgi:hypothetical protein